MKIKCIFELLKDVLFAASFAGDKADVLKDLLDKWTDVIYLEEFFENNIQDLESGYFGSITVEEAIEETIEAAQELFEKLYEADGANLDSMFVPLDNREFKEYDFQKMKAKRAKSWLRLYAVHYFDQYVITGGAIKLTLKMEDREHTRKELKKLETVKNILKFNQGEDLFVYLNP